MLKVSTLSGLLIVVAELAACGARAPDAPKDNYDPAQMEFRSPPARVTSERHTGAFSSGPSLNPGARLNSLDPAQVKDVRLDTTHKIIEIAPGLKYSAWTFGDQVPGPAIRARVGDRIRFTMTNRSDEPVPALRVTDAPMMHSMDFHSAMVSPQDKYRSIAPGQTIDLRVHAQLSGRLHVPLRHADDPRAHRLGHVRDDDRRAAGRLPDQGRSRVRDRAERVLCKTGPRRSQGRRGAPSCARPASACAPRSPRTRCSMACTTVWSTNPLAAKPGERVRLFVLNVGPSRTSSFHVVGTIFDRVWFEGNPDNQFRGMQTVLLGSSNSAIVEFIIPEAGSYIMVDHHFANASQGAIGLISTEAEPRRAELEHHNFPATATPTDPAALQGKLDFESKCLACHSIGFGPKLGPDLAGVTKKRSDAWLTRWLKAPEKMLETDAEAQSLLKEWNNVPMPNQNLSDEEIANYLKFFHWADAQPAGTVKPMAEVGGATSCSCTQPRVSFPAMPRMSSSGLPSPSRSSIEARPAPPPWPPPTRPASTSPKPPPICGCGADARPCFAM